MSAFLVRPEKFTSRTEDFGYQYLSFQLRQLTAGETYSSLTGGTELALVALASRCSVPSSGYDEQRPVRLTEVERNSATAILSTNATRRTAIEV